MGNHMTFTCERWYIHLIFMSLTNSFGKQRGKAQLCSAYCSTERWMGFMFSIQHIFFLREDGLFSFLMETEHRWPKWNIDLCKREESGFVIEWASMFPLYLSLIAVSLDISSLTCETRSAQPFDKLAAPITCLFVCAWHISSYKGHICYFLNLCR